MSGAPTAARLVDRVQANVAQLLTEFATLAADSTSGSATGVPVFTQRLRDYVGQFGSMRRTRVAAHALDGFRGTEEAALIALGHACAALELFHTAALIHDDIIDESPTRRHHPAFHIGWSGITDLTSADTPALATTRLDVAAGLLGGDALLVLAARAIDRIDTPSRDRVAHFFQETQLRTVVGEFQDSVLEQCRTRADRTVITEMSVNKTAWYTVIAPMILAARCAGADERCVPLLVAAGSAYGEAFQLLDDLNEVLAEPALTGKNSLDDMNAGKATLLHHIVTAHASPAERAGLSQVYGRGDCTERDLDQYRRLVHAHITQITVDLRKLMNRARTLLRDSGLGDHIIGRIEHELNPHDQLPVHLDESA
ncbi:polyprenyl synthetase family protein [Nocardia sp. NPDC051321]|uniref:polyprenyl synthetase family protein n=1 Tax=Nocardia sp. NPDC051321 TaxID=3364323 RepID=UPI0037BAAF07